MKKKIAVRQLCDCLWQFIPNIYKQLIAKSIFIKQQIKLNLLIEPTLDYFYEQLPSLYL